MKAIDYLKYLKGGYFKKKDITYCNCSGDDDRSGTM